MSDEVPTDDGLILMPLAPEGAFDFIANIQPPYRNLVTGEVGELKALSQAPGAVWWTFWIPDKPYMIRLRDGAVGAYARVPDSVAIPLQQAAL